MEVLGGQGAKITSTEGDCPYAQNEIAAGGEGVEVLGDRSEQQGKQQDVRQE